MRRFVLASKDAMWVEEASVALDIIHGDDIECTQVESGDELLEALEKDCINCDSVVDVVIVDSRLNLWPYFKVIRDKDNWPLQRVLVMFAGAIGYDDQAKAMKEGVDILPCGTKWWQQLIQYLSEHKKRDNIGVRR